MPWMIGSHPEKGEKYGNYRIDRGDIIIGAIHIHITHNLYFGSIVFFFNYVDNSNFLILVLADHSFQSNAVHISVCSFNNSYIIYLTIVVQVEVRYFQIRII
jgi:hypothetical protein